MMRSGPGARASGTGAGARAGPPSIKLGLDRFAGAAACCAQWSPARRAAGRGGAVRIVPRSREQGGAHGAIIPRYRHAGAGFVRGPPRGGAADAPRPSPARYPLEDFPGCESFRLPASEVDRYEGRLEFWDGRDGLEGLRSHLHLPRAAVPAIGTDGRTVRDAARVAGRMLWARRTCCVWMRRAGSAG